MAVNGKKLLEYSPIKNMLTTKEKHYGVSHGLSEAGYDIRIKQDVTFFKGKSERFCMFRDKEQKSWKQQKGSFVIASAIEEFDMPEMLVGIVHDKSTWARKGLSVFNTVIEPNWKGFLTLELVYHGDKDLHIPAGSGIAQVIFHELSCPARYEGKYQNQENKPVEARKS